jgi:hypothetical protein
VGPGDVDAAWDAGPAPGTGSLSPVPGGSSPGSAVDAGGLVTDARPGGPQVGDPGPNAGAGESPGRVARTRPAENPWTPPMRPTLPVSNAYQRYTARRGASTVPVTGTAVSPDAGGFSPNSCPRPVTFRVLTPHEPSGLPHVPRALRHRRSGGPGPHRRGRAQRPRTAHRLPGADLCRRGRGRGPVAEDARAGRWMSRIEDEAGRMESPVDDLLTLSRVDEAPRLERSDMEGPPAPETAPALSLTRSARPFDHQRPAGHPPPGGRLRTESSGTSATLRPTGGRGLHGVVTQTEGPKERCAPVLSPCRRCGRCQRAGLRGARSRRSGNERRLKGGIPRLRSRSPGPFTAGPVQQ